MRYLLFLGVIDVMFMNFCSHSIIYFQILYDTTDKVVGIATNDMGVAKDGSKKDNFQPGVELKGKSYDVNILPVS